MPVAIDPLSETAAREIATLAALVPPQPAEVEEQEQTVDTTVPADTIEEVALETEAGPIVTLSGGGSRYADDPGSLIALLTGTDQNSNTSLGAGPRLTGVGDDAELTLLATAAGVVPNTPDNPGTGIPPENDRTSDDVDPVVPPTANESSGVDATPVILQTSLVFSLIEPIDEILVLVSGESFIGGNGNETLTGGDGDDILRGGPGDDFLTGGFGQDTFLYAAGDTGSDVITDFSLADGDVLDLEGLLVGDPGTAAELDSYLDFTLTGADTTIAVDAQGDGSGPEVTILLAGLDLTAAGTLSDEAIIADLLANENLVV